MPDNLNRRQFLKTTTAVAATMAMPKLAAGQSSRPQGRANLIYVFSDQMRFSACAYRELADPTITPNIDRFAKQSVTLTHTFSTFPVCSPYRAQLMTGNFPLTNGVTTNCNSGNPGLQLRQSDVCLTDVLNKSGYDIGYIGKWHLEYPHQPFVMKPPADGVMWNEYTPPERRHGITYWHGFNDYDNHLNPEYWIGKAPRDQRTAIHEFSPEYETNVAIDFLRNTDGKYRDGNKPFALFVSHNPPHTPYHQVPAKYREQYGDATPAELLKRGNVDLTSDHPNAKAGRNSARDYFALCTGIDDNFGRLLAEIDRLGQADNTLVVFTSDHGDMMGSHNRMAKTVWYDESYRVPFIARLPGKLQADKLDDLLITAADIAPTLLGTLGITPPSQWEGHSYAAALQGQPMDRPTSTLYFHTSRHARGLRTHQWCYVINKKPQQTGVESDGHEVPVYLFDMHDDPYQMHNLAGQRPEVEKQLQDELRVWLKRTNDPYLV
jgi:arylsulfatase A-like enzyme